MLLQYMRIVNAVFQRLFSVIEFSVKHFEKKKVFPKWNKNSLNSANSRNLIYR